MTKREVNNDLMYRIGYTKPEEIEELRKEYNKIIKTLEDEKDFYYSVLSWWNDGNASYYDKYLERVWK